MCNLANVAVFEVRVVLPWISLISAVSRVTGVWRPDQRWDGIRDSRLWLISSQHLTSDREHYWILAQVWSRPRPTSKSTQLKAETRIQWDFNNCTYLCDKTELWNFWDLGLELDNKMKYSTQSIPSVAPCDHVRHVRPFVPLSRVVMAPATPPARVRLTPGAPPPICNPHWDRIYAWTQSPSRINTWHLPGQMAPVALVAGQFTPSNCDPGFDSEFWWQESESESVWADKCTMWAARCRYSPLARSKMW